MDFTILSSKKPGGEDVEIRPFLLSKLKRLDSRIGPKQFAEYIDGLRADNRAYKVPTRWLVSYLDSHLPSRCIVAVYRNTITVKHYSHEFGWNHLELLLPGWLSRLTEKFVEFEETDRWPLCDLDENGNLKREVLLRWVLESE